MNAFNLIGWLMDNLLALIPLRVVASNEQGVRKVRGLARRTLPPGGPYWHIRGLFEVHKMPTAEQGLNLPTQTVTTKDGQERTLSMNIQYDIQQAHLTYTYVHDLDESIAFRGMSALAQMARGLTARQLARQQEQVEDGVQAILGAWAARVGLRILAVGITDHVGSRSLRIFGDSTATPIPEPAE